MRAYEFRGTGLESLKMVERPVPRVGAAEVLVRIRAASLNHRDLYVAAGTFGRGDLGHPLVPLSDGAGEVISVGAEVTRWKGGDRVMGAFFPHWIDGPASPEKQADALGGNVDGVLAEEVALRAEAVVRIPDTLSYEEAATLPCAGVTAWVGLMELGALDANQTILALGTGGVSVFAVQLAKAVGARAIVTSGSDEKLARASKLGADGTINYREMPAWDTRVRTLTGGRGIDQILEVAGAKTLARSLGALRDGGHLTLVGLLGGERATLQMADNDRGIRVDGVYVGSVAHLKTLADFVERTRLRPIVDRTFPFADAPAAYGYLESGQHFGKVVIRL